VKTEMKLKVKYFFKLELKLKLNYKSELKNGSHMLTANRSNRPLISGVHV